MSKRRRKHWKILWTYYKYFGIGDFVICFVFDISFVQFKSTVASVPAPTTWRATCNEECCCIRQRQKENKRQSTWRRYSANQRTYWMDRRPRVVLWVGRVEHRTANISCVKKTLLLSWLCLWWTRCRYDESIIRFRRFSLDDSIILRCVVNREICAGHSIEYHRDAELLCCAEVSTSSYTL